MLTKKNPVNIAMLTNGAPALWEESSFEFVHVSLSNFIGDAKCHTKKNPAMPAVWYLGMESSFNFVRVSLLNFIGDAKCKKNIKNCHARRVIAGNGEQL